MKSEISDVYFRVARERSCDMTRRPRDRDLASRNVFLGNCRYNHVQLEL